MFSQSKEIQEKAAKVLEIVKRKTRRGASNAPMAGESLDEVAERRKAIRFGAEMSEQICDLKNIQARYTYNDPAYQKFYFFLYGFFSELDECANCGGRAALAMYELMLEEITCGIELIGVTDGTPDTNHAFVLLNRDSKDEIKTDLSLRNVVSLDAWPPVDRVKHHDLFTKADLVNPAIKQISEVKSLLAFERPFTYRDLETFRNFLMEVKTSVTLAMVTEVLRQCDRTNINPASELQRIQRALDQKISFYNTQAEQKHKLHLQRRALNTSTARMYAGYAQEMQKANMEKAQKAQENQSTDTDTNEAVSAVDPFIGSEDAEENTEVRKPFTLTIPAFTPSNSN